MTSPQATSEAEIFSEIRNSVATITLNRPKALNALSLTLLQQMRVMLDSFAQDDSVYAVVIKGAGDRAFCAGGDIKALYQAAKAGAPLHHEFFCTEYPINHLIFNYPKPYVALMDHVVMGGGMGISQGSKFRIVTERSKLAMPEAGIGLIPDVGGSYFLSRLPGATGMYLALTGNVIGAGDAIALGLADIYMPSEKLPALEQALLDTRWTLEPTNDLRATLRRLSEAPPTDVPIRALRKAIDLHFTRQSVADIMYSLEREDRPELSEWAQLTLVTLNKRSPTSMAVVYDQIVRGRHLSLADCLRMELDLVTACFEFGDIMEGIRSVLIDKDHSPKWNPPTVAELKSENIGRFFFREWPNKLHPLAHLK
jgi:enoyl-CoA hydratase/carnithine racemase